MLQSVPVYPTAQEQLNAPTLLEHTPPFAHGVDAHSSISETCHNIKLGEISTINKSVFLYIKKIFSVCFTKQSHHYIFQLLNINQLELCVQ